MDKFDRNNIVKAALNVLKCADVPFLLAIFDGSKLKTFFKPSIPSVTEEHTSKYINCRLRDGWGTELSATFDDKSEPAVPHGYGFICGKCASIESSDGGATLCVVDECSRDYRVYAFGKAHEYAGYKIQCGDGLKLKVKISPVTGQLIINEPTDILSHTRTIVTTTELKKE